jgi:hypothetical protein
MTPTRLLFAAAGLFLLLPLRAQHYQRTRHNIGLTATYSPFEWNSASRNFSASARGSMFALGLTRSYNDWLYPELFYVHRSNALPQTAETVAPSNYTLHEAGAGLLVKLDLFSIDNHKRDGYCFGRVVNLLAGADYVQPLASSGLPAASKTKGEIGLKAGLGMYSVWGGSAKKHQAWTIHWETFARYGMNPFLTVPASTGDSDYRHLTAGLTLRVIHHKVYKFSDM